MAYMKIEFEKGGTFTAKLLEDEAPKTCKTIKERLPFEYRFHQSIVSGQAVVTLPPDLTVERENQRVAGIPPGAYHVLTVTDSEWEGRLQGPGELAALAADAEDVDVGAESTVQLSLELN